MSDLDEMFAEALEAEENETVDESPADNLEIEDEESEVEEPDEVEDIETDIDAAEDEDNTVEVPDSEEDAEMETIVIDGEEVRVTKQELRDGYLRRRDYSQKTAEAAQVRKQAEWAQAIQEAFESDPAGTIQALAQAYGIQPGATQQPEGNPYEDLDPDVAVVLKRLDEQEQRHQAELAQLKRQTEEFSRKQIVEEVRAELQGLKAEYGEELDEKLLLETAAMYNLPLAVAANALMGEQAIKQRKVSAEAAAKAAAATSNRKSKQTAEKRQAKKTATGTLSGSSANGSSGEISPDDFETLEDLFALMAE
jgi:hypothetical protein